MKKVAVILSGAGVFDGSELHEAVSCVARDRKGGSELALLCPKY